jgi:hypothetical protein
MRIHSLVLPLLPFTSDSAEIQMLLGRIHSPPQRREEERHEQAKRGQSNEDLPEAAHQGLL